jgi:hypothetical protein
MIMHTLKNYKKETLEFHGIDLLVEVEQARKDQYQDYLKGGYGYGDNTTEPTLTRT